MNYLKKPEILLFVLIALFSLFFRIKIIHELPLGTTTTEYGLQGFDDEPAHFNYSAYLIKNHQLPVEKHTVSDSDAFEINEFEYHQPPLYYLAVATFCELFKLTNTDSQLLIGRYLNLLITLFSFYILYLIFIQVDWKNEQAFTGLAIIALLGSHVYQTSLFSNDALSWLLLFWIFYLIIKGSLKNWLLISVLFTIAHYTKTNVLVIYPVLIWSFYTEFKKDPIRAKQKAIIILLTPFILALPWYIRNYQLYDSFLLLSGSQWHFVANYFDSFTKLIHAPYSFLFRMHFLPAKTLISVFNYLQYLFVFPLIVIGVWKSVKIVRQNHNNPIFFIMLLTMLAAYLWLAIPTGFTEGRMLFPALPVIIYFLCLPIFDLQAKFKLQAHMKYFILLLLFVPPYIIGFYFLN